jgi:GNAT superfamily N-acetyltransferase
MSRFAAGGVSNLIPRLGVRGIVRGGLVCSRPLRPARIWTRSCETLQHAVIDRSEEVPMLEIRPLKMTDRTQWQALWQGYLRFYRQSLAPEITEGSFTRLVDGERQSHGIVAERDGRLLGFAHYLFHASSWSAPDICYLEDLFVDPAVRGRGAGRALIHAVYAAADLAQAGSVYWMTQEFNADGRALYDTLARRTSFIRYER